MILYLIAALLVLFPLVQDVNQSIDYSHDVWYNNTSNTCYGVECVDPIPSEISKWNYTSEYCDRIYVSQKEWVNATHLKITIDRYCYI